MAKIFIKIICFLTIITIISCSTSKNLIQLPEDKSFLNKKCVGKFLESKDSGDSTIMWIKTTKDTVFGKILVYGHDCKFIKGERLYIKKVYNIEKDNDNIWECWMYRLENKDKVSFHYKIAKFQYKTKILIQE